MLRLFQQERPFWKLHKVSFDCLWSKPQRHSHNVLASESQENQKAESTLIIAKHFFFFLKVSGTSERTLSLLKVIFFCPSCCTPREKVNLNSPISKLLVAVDFEQCVSDSSQNLCCWLYRARQNWVIGTSLDWVERLGFVTDWRRPQSGDLRWPWSQRPHLGNGWGAGAPCSLRLFWDVLLKEVPIWLMPYTFLYSHGWLLAGLRSLKLSPWFSSFYLCIFHHVWFLYQQERCRYLTMN